MCFFLTGGRHLLDSMALCDVLSLRAFSFSFAYSSSFYISLALVLLNSMYVSGSKSRAIFTKSGIFMGRRLSDELILGKLC